LKLEKVKEFDVAGAVHKHIEILATKDLLEQKEQTLKMEYKGIFEPIPHAGELPDDVVA